MAIPVSVQNKFQTIVPVRIERAVTGEPKLDAPDMDDRGWIRNNAAGLNVSDARGGLFSATVNDVVRFKVVRDDLDANAPLFVTVTGNQVEIAQPVGGGPLPGDGIFSVRAVRDTTTGSKVQVRLGAKDGPVICEADAHTFTLLTLPVTPHLCVIHQAARASAGTGRRPTVGGLTLNDARLQPIFDIARAVWRPAGIDLRVGAARIETFEGFVANNFAARGAEEDTVMGRRQAANTCNIYFLSFMDTSLGVGVNKDTRAANGFTRSGILVATEGSSADSLGNGLSNRTSTGNALIQEIGNDVAHEIGHFLTLPHAANVDATPATPNGLEDTYGRRRLMHPLNLLPNAVSPATATSRPRFSDIGYGVGDSGSGHRGCLLTLKDHPSDSSDGEAVQTRRRFRVIGFLN